MRENHIDVLDLPVSLLSKSEMIAALTRFLNDDKIHHVVTANSLLALEAKKNPLLKKICKEAALVLADSSGMTWAAQSLGHPKPIRWPGIDFAFELCALAEIENKPVYLLGGRSGIAEQAAHFLNAAFPYLMITGMRDGFFTGRDEEAIIHDIAASRAKVVLVALGSPRQEIWIFKNLAHLPPAVYVGVGGSFDVWAGYTKRAPVWARQMGMEWAYRLWQEPSRLGRMLKLPLFVLNVLNAKRHA